MILNRLHRWLISSPNRKEKQLFQARIKTPTILQMESTECGSTALSIIMAHYGRHITAEEARIACSVSRDGTKAINIIKAARNYGMNAYGSNLDIPQLNAIKVPFIVYWEFNHFLIVEGYTESLVYLNDPATGPRQIDWNEFENGFTGVALEIAPGEGFKSGGGTQQSILTLLLQKLGNNTLSVFFIVLATLALIIPKAATPLFTKAFIDQLLIDNQKTLILVILSGIGFTTLAEALLTAFQTRFLNRLKIKLEVINAVSFLWHLFHIPIRYFQQRSSGDIVNRSDISEKIAAVLASDLPTNIVGLLEMSAFAGIIFLLSWKMGIVLLILVLLNGLSLQYSKRYLTDIGHQYAQNKGKLEGIETNGIQIIETLKVSAMESHFFNRWVAFYTKFLNTEQQLLWRIELLELVPMFLGFLANLTIICYGSWLVMTGSITIGTIVALQALMGGFLKPMQKLIEFINRLNQFKGDMVRLNDVMNTAIDPGFCDKVDCRDQLLSTTSHPILQINKLSYSYSSLDPPIIDQLSLVLNPGERIAIAGPSGSGKSSLAKLICGIDSPGSGEILLNGIPSSQISRCLLSEYLAYVDQTILFFPGSLRDNLTLWDTSIHDNQIHDVLKTVYLQEEVLARGGLGITINERGSNFSGGQCQRLEIARALLRRPKLLILDEATSAMDTILESKIYKNLMSMNCSLFIIAHRLSAIRDCDRIYLLDQGTILQEGNHDSLMKNPGLYRTLVGMEE